MSPIKKPKAIIFDVNETLLSMAEVKQKVNGLFDDSKAFSIWFGLVLQYSLVDTVTNNFHDFAALAKAALQMTANMMGQKLPAEDDAKQIALLLTQMPPHPEVANALRQLQQGGFTLVTLTNSTLSSSKLQLRNAGLIDFFEDTFSVESINKYKPSLDTYDWAAAQLGLNSSDILMVAAHGWDVAGAQKAGMQSAFIARPGQTLYPLAASPTYNCKDIAELALILIRA